jgi:hypothetical protein
MDPSQFVEKPLAAALAAFDLARAAHGNDPVPGPAALLLDLAGARFVDATTAGTPPDVVTTVIFACAPLNVAGLLVGAASRGSATDLSEIAARLGAAHQLRTVAVHRDRVDPGPLRRIVASAARLRRLDLSAAWLGPAGMAALRPAVAQQAHLRYLSLASNRLGPEGMAALGGALPHLTRLRHLDVSSNALLDAAAASLAAALPALRSLRRLVARDNGFSGDAAVALFAALPSAPALRYVDVGARSAPKFFKVSDADAAAVAGALVAMKQLRVLELSAENLTVAGWQKLADAMADAPWMERLEIDDVAPVAVSDSRIVKTSSW